MRLEDLDREYGFDTTDDDSDVHTSIELIDWATLHERPDEIVEGLVIPGRWTSLVAPAKAGKSLLLIAVTTAISLGLDPFTATPAEPVGCLYVDAEMGRLDLAERLTDLGHDPASLTKWYATDLPPRLDTPEGGMALAVTATQLDAQVVVVDGMNGTVTGPENDDMTWRNFYQHTIAPLKAAGVAVLTGDNMGKDKAQGPRGSSVKMDKPDAVMTLARSDDGVTLTATHRRTAAYGEKLSLAMSGVGGDEYVTYRRTGALWPAGTKETSDLLDRLGVPLDATVSAAQETLRRAGDGRRREAVAAAIRWRQNQHMGMI